MRKHLSRHAVWLAPVPLVILCASVLFAALLDEDTKVEDLFDWGLYKSLVAEQATGLQDLADRFVLDQYLYLWITPPDKDFILFQPGGMAPILDLKAFPDSFIGGLAGVEENGIRKFPVWVYEDADSSRREIVIQSLEGKEIARIPREWDYASDWFARDRYPELDTYDKWYRDWLLACYDPSRVCMRYDLIVGEDDLIKYVWAQSIAAAQAAEEGGGMMTMDWGGGSVTNLQFVEIKKEAHACITVKLAYPDDFTNRLDVFTCDGGTGLIDFWWEPGVNTNVNASTNWIAWTDPESSNAYVNIRFYAAANADVDSDGDGYSDGFEKYVYHTCPTNEDSYPVSVSGSISYTGSLTGPVRMIAVTESNSWLGCMATMASLGAYTNSKIANGASYWFKAYRDCNNNKVREYGEPWGVYTNVSILVTNNLTGIDITLADDSDEDQDGLPDWWELQYFASIWTQDGDDDSDGDSLSNAEEYGYGTDPANTHNSLLPYSTGFESTNSYSTGTLSGQNGWLSDEGATVQSGMAHTGGQAVELEALESTMTKHFATTNDSVTAELFVYLGPQFSVPSDLPDAASSLVSFEAGTGIRGFDGNGSGGGTWPTASGTANLLNQWVDLKIVQDYSAKTWSLYVNDDLKLSGLGFKDDSVTQLDAMHVRSGIGGAVHCDDINVQ